MNTDRIYQGEDDHWYFNVRGNQAKGPFTSYADAEAALTRHVLDCRRPLGGTVWPKPLRGLKFGRQRLSEPSHT